MPLLQLGADIPVILCAAQLKWKSTFATPSKAHKSMEEKYFGKDQLILNWFVVLLLTLLPLIALLAVILTSKDLPDTEQDDSTSFH